MFSPPLAGARPVATTTVFMIAITFAGCGGGSAATSTTAASAPTTDAATTETQSTTTTGRSPQATAADRKVAQAGTLRLSDFPSGWEESDTESPSQAAKCPAIRTAKDTATVRKPSSDFDTHNGNTTASNVMYVYADEAAARKAVAAATSRETRVCIGKLVGDLIQDEVKGEDVQVGEITTGQVSVPAGVGDDRHAVRVTIPFTSDGTDITATADYDFMRVGRAVNILSLTDVLTPFDEDLHEQLARRTTARLRTAVAAARQS